MTKVTPIEPTIAGSEFDGLYNDVGTAIGDAKAVACCLSAADQDNFDASEVGFALERILMNAEELLSQIWKFHPGHRGS